MGRLDTTSPVAYAKTVEPYREIFATQVIGRFDLEPLQPNVRSRKVYDEPRYTGYEVVMDVFPDVITSGVLLFNTVRPEFCCSEFVIAIIEHVCCRHGQQMGALRGRPIG